MKKRVTKQAKDTLKWLVIENGYWSPQVKVFCEQFEHAVAMKLHDYARNVMKENER